MPVTTIDPEYKANEKIENDGIEEKHISKGTTFADNYKVLSEREKKGGMGKIILCKSLLDNKYYVLKKIIKQDLKYRFEREIDIALKLEKNPYIVYTQTAIKENDELYIVMELVGKQPNSDTEEWGNNVTLFDLLHKEKLSIEEKFKWMIEFCCGMQYLNSIGIETHQDIKPTNIFITEDRHVKIGDFGLATTDGQLEGGTKQYQAPEIFKIKNDNKKKEITRQSDIYSFGMVLYEIFNDGKNPYDERMYLEDYEIRNPSNYCSAIIQKCGKEDPDKRYNNFEEIEIALENEAKQCLGNKFKIKNLTVEKYNALDLFFKGNGYFNIGKFEEAITYYSKAIKLDNKESLFYYNRANAKRKLKQKSNALKDLDTAIELEPIKDMEYYFERGELKYELEQYKEAIKDFKISIKKDSDNPKKYFFMAKCEYELKEYNKALEHCDRVLKIDSQNYEIYCLKGRINIELEQYEQAVKDLNTAIEIIKAKSVDNYTEVYYYRGKANHYLGKDEQALDDFNFVIRKAKGDQEDYYNIGWIKYTRGEYLEAILNFDIAKNIAKKEAEKNNSEPKNLDVYYYYKGLSRFNLGIEELNNDKAIEELEQSIKDFDEAIKINLSYKEAFLYRGKAKYHLGKYAGAAKDFDKVIELDSENIEALFSLGIINLKSHKYDLSVLCFDKVIKFNPFYPNVYLERGKAESYLKEYEKQAIKDFNREIAENPKCLQAYIERAKLNIKLNKKEEAFKDFNDAIQICQDNPEIYFERGKIAFDLEEYIQASKDFNEYLRLIDSKDINTDFYYYKGIVNYKLQKYEEAVKGFDEIIQRKAENKKPYSLYEIYLYRGISKYNLKQYEESIKDLNDAAKIYPSGSQVYYERGRSKYELGKYEQAKLDFRKAIEINPKYSQAYYERAMTNKKLGKQMQAIKDFDEALKINPNFSQAYIEKAKLESNASGEKALEDIDKAIEKNPYYVRAYIERAKLKVQLDKKEEAFKDFNDAIKICQDNPEIYFERGKANFKAEKYQQALEDFYKYINLSNPKNIDMTVYYYKGIAYLKLKKNEYALTDFDVFSNYISANSKKLIADAGLFLTSPLGGLINIFTKKKNNNNNIISKIYYYKGIAYLQLEDNKKALEYFDKAIKTDPDFLQTYLKMGVANTNLGNYKNAISNFKKVIVDDPKNEEAYNGLNRISEMSRNKDNQDTIRKILKSVNRLKE